MTHDHPQDRWGPPPPGGVTRWLARHQKQVKAALALFALANVTLLILVVREGTTWIGISVPICNLFVTGTTWFALTRSLPEQVRHWDENR